MGRAGTHVTQSAQPLTVDFSEAPDQGALLSWVQQFSPFGVITLNRLLQVQTWNRWMEFHSGLMAGEVQGKELFALFPELTKRKVRAHFDRALKGESCVLSTAFHHYLIPLRASFREPGRTRMLQTARIAPLFSRGNICGVVVILEDVTQRESQAEALRRQHRRDEILSWALVHLLKPEEPRKTVRQLFFKVAEYLDFDTFCLYLRDSSQGKLDLYASGGVPTQSGKAFESSCPFMAEDSSDPSKVMLIDSIQKRGEPEYADLKKAGILAAIRVPLQVETRNLGQLCFATAGRESITSEESDLLSTIGQYLATAIDRENTSRELRLAKEQLSDHAQHLEQKVHERTLRLEETISELETFSYTVAHDLKAPIRGMNGYCTILLEDMAEPLPAGAKAIVKKLARTTQRMETLAHDLLAFTKVSRQEVVLSRVEPEPVIQDVLAMHSQDLVGAVTIRKPLAPVLAQRELLQQVFANLIDNAIKFVKQDTAPRVTVYSEAVQESGLNIHSVPLLFSSPPGPELSFVGRPESRPRGFIRIWVVDEGIGIPREVYHKIFGIFVRAVTSERYEGTGIGLAIVARAMQRLGGTCGVESELDKGSRFWIELPAA